MQSMFSTLKQMMGRVVLVLMLVGLFSSLSSPALAANTDYYGTSRPPVNERVDRQGVESDSGKNQTLDQPRGKTQAAEYEEESYDELTKAVEQPRGVEQEYEKDLKTYRQSQKD